ncbi:MAG: translation initiation factor IF-2 [Rhodospirillales bacterium]
MTDTNDQNSPKGPTAGRPGKLELKKTVETGQVRQSFSHGRSKMVTVEVRKKRTFAADAGGRLTEVARHEGEGGRGGRGSSRDASTGLTNREKEARARALQDFRRAEDERAHAPVTPVEEVAEALPPVEADATSSAPEIVPAAEPAPVDASAEPQATAPETEAAPPVAPPAQTAAAEGAAPTAATQAGAPQAGAASPPAAMPAEPGPAAAPAAAKPGEAVLPRRDGTATTASPRPASDVGDDEGDGRGRTTKRVARTDVKRGAGAATARRTDGARRAGKISVFDDPEGAGERMRSLASVRRAREKERLKQLQNARMEAKVVRDVVVPELITIQELANRMAERGADVIKSLMRMGVMATITQSIDADTAELVVAEFGHNLKRVSDADVEIGLRGESDIEVDLVSRPPVVTVMGHVDHGKTSLLDALRKTDVAVHEAGGITQHIGAYQVTLAGGNKITFIDTPGHAAFTQMRARGAQVTDIVVLVVAADDGVMPQTAEAITHAKAADVPIIVAINKIDRPDATPDRVRTELLQYGIQVEEMGGETLSVPVSAKQGTNLDKLTEAILLQAEVLDLKANPNRTAEGVIIETKVERGRGAVATCLVQRGTLKVGDIFVAGSEWGRVRGLMDASGDEVQTAGPGTPVEILGLNGTPAAGDDLVVVASEARAREVTEFRQRRLRDARTTATRGTFEQMMTRIQQGQTKELALLIKADVHGSTEAIVGALEKLSTADVGVNVLHAGVGGINESDVTLARASNALIIGFNVRANPQAREMARRDGVEIRYYSIIYELADQIKQLLSGMLSPTLKEHILGYAEIREVFTITKVGKIAGCMVTEGIVRRGGRLRLLRDSVVIHEGELAQLKRFKEDVREVKEGYDCGIAIGGYQDIQVGDTIECFEIQEVARQL